MRNRKNRSFNIDQLPIKRILWLSLLAYVLVFIEALFLTSYRMLSLPYALSLFCSNDADFFVTCVNEVMKLVLYSWQWSAAKFSVYVATLTPLFYFSIVRQKGSIASTMLLLMLIVLVAIVSTIAPPWVELMSVLMSVLIATCFIKRKRDEQRIG